MLDAALEYASRGWNIFPITPGGKTPLTPNGFKDATNETEVVRGWWTRWPSANIGLATGSLYSGGQGGIPTSDIADEVDRKKHDALLVIDIDPRNGGTVPPELPPTLTAVTGGGGLHYYYTYPLMVGDRQRFRRILQEGVDIKAEGGYIILPPSATENRYKYLSEETPIAPCPDWLLEACQKPQDANLRVETGGVGDDPTDTRPGSIFNRTASWSDILEPHGWAAVYRQGDEVFWRRPGKGEGISATTNYSDSGLLHVFTSSTEFDPDTAYSPFAALALLNFGGDFRDAALSLEQTQLIDTANLATITSKREQYDFQPAFPEGHFVSDFIDYCALQTDASREYAEAAGLVLLSMVTARSKASLAPYPTGLSTNLYVSLVGPTTRSRKSTVQRIAGEIAKAVNPSSLLPNRATTEALIKALSQRNNNVSVWMPDEFGVALAEIYSRDFMSGLEELLLTVYGGDDYVYERSNDEVRVRSPHLSVLAAATPESISRSGAVALESGLLPRFAVVYPATLPEQRPVTNTAPNLSSHKSHLISRLHQVQAWSNVHKEITFSDEALELLNEAESHLTRGSGTARLSTMLYKASILALSGSRHVSDIRIGGDDENRVEAGHAQSAIAVVDRWRRGVENLVPLLYKGGTDPALESQMQFALSVLKDEGGKAARTVVARALSTTKAKLDIIESTLLDRGSIKMQTEGGKVWELR
jgi:hypothetical protein